MRHKRYARPRLITSDDRRYRDYVAQFLLQRQNQRAMRPPRQRDIFGNQTEAALRIWLAQHQTLSDRRILEYEEQQGRRAHTKYRELDAVVLEDHGSIWVFEIKASRAPHTLRRALSQLQETRAILHLLYPRVHTTILLVDTGMPTAEQIAELMSGPEPPTTPPATLDETIAALPMVSLIESLEQRSTESETIDLLCFDVEDIIAIAGAENLALDWSADDEIDETPMTPRDPTTVYSTANEPDADESEADGGALAAALRRAGLSTDQ